MACVNSRRAGGAGACPWRDSWGCLMETTQTINSRRVMLGGLAGGVVWSIWTIIVNIGILLSRYTAAAQAGLILQQPRYSLFVAYRIITMFLLSYVVAWLYASARATRGAGYGAQNRTAGGLRRRLPHEPYSRRLVANRPRASALVDDRSVGGRRARVARRRMGLQGLARLAFTFLLCHRVPDETLEHVHRRLLR